MSETWTDRQKTTSALWTQSLRSTDKYKYCTSPRGIFKFLKHPVTDGKIQYAGNPFSSKNNVRSFKNCMILSVPSCQPQRPCLQIYDKIQILYFSPTMPLNWIILSVYYVELNLWQAWFLEPFPRSSLNLSIFSKDFLGSHLLQWTLFGVLSTIQVRTQ